MSDKWRHDYTPKVVFMLQIYGDWYSVIRAVEPEGPLWDHLLRQKPTDESDADYFAYRLRFDDSAGLFEAAEAFRKQKLRVDIAVEVKSEELGLETFAATGDGFGKVDKFGWAKRAPTNLEAVREAVARLRQVLAEVDADDREGDGE